MRRIILSLLMTLIAIPVFAGTTLLSGSWGEVKGEIPVALNWKMAVYAKGGGLEEFLLKAKRSDDWESRSLSYFLKEVNERVKKYGVTLVENADTTAPEYRIEIVTYTISKGGNIKGKILLFSRESEEPVASVSFSSDENDDNDKIAFRDQLESVGESFGKLLRRQLKQSHNK